MDGKIGKPNAAIAPSSSWFLFCSTAEWSVKVCRSSWLGDSCGDPTGGPPAPSLQSWKFPWCGRASGWLFHALAATPATLSKTATNECGTTERLSFANASDAFSAFLPLSLVLTTTTTFLLPSPSPMTSGCSSRFPSPSQKPRLNRANRKIKKNSHRIIRVVNYRRWYRYRRWASGSTMTSARGQLSMGRLLMTSIYCYQYVTNQRKPLSISPAAHAICCRSMNGWMKSVEVVDIKLASIYLWRTLNEVFVTQHREHLAVLGEGHVALVDRLQLELLDGRGDPQLNLLLSPFLGIGRDLQSVASRFDFLLRMLKGEANDWLNVALLSQASKQRLQRQRF